MPASPFPAFPMNERDNELFEENSSLESSGEINRADIRFAAMNYLARREHTRLELKRKLKRRFDDEELLNIELDRLAEENLQSDARFACSYALQRSGRGYGLMRVQQEMRDRGLSDLEIATALDSIDADWQTIAEEVYRKKFGDAPAVDLKEKSRRSRFMQYRGFDSEHYRHLLKY
jgi:regulatory protein